MMKDFNSLVLSDSKNICFFKSSALYRLESTTTICSIGSATVERGGSFRKLPPQERFTLLQVPHTLLPV